MPLHFATENRCSLQQESWSMVAILALPSQRALFAVTGTNPTTYRSDVHRAQGAAAFGVAEPIFKDRPLALDAVAICLRDELNERGLSREVAAAVVRGFFDRWAEGISHADHDDQDVIFGVVELDPQKFPDTWRCAVGPAEKLDEYLKGLPRPQRRALFVHLRETLAGIRGRATKAKLDLSGRFFVPPYHPLIAKTRSYWEKWRAHNNVGPRVKFPKPDRPYRQSIEALLQ
jgi:hypothetical protein